MAGAFCLEEDCLHLLFGILLIEQTRSLLEGAHVSFSSHATQTHLLDPAPLVLDLLEEAPTCLAPQTASRVA